MATALRVPLEACQISHRPTVLKGITLVINVAIVVYLVIAKRQCGLRGGARAERELCKAGAGWSALERAMHRPLAGAANQDTGQGVPRARPAAAAAIVDTIADPVAGDAAARYRGAQGGPFGSVLGLVIFAGFTMFDFQRLRTNTDATTAPFLAASIFLDVLNVFLFFLQIFSQEQR